MKARYSHLNRRRLLVVLHDLTATAAAVVGSFYLRFDLDGLMARLDKLYVMLPCIVLYAGIVYHFFELYQGKWRFASLADLFNIFRAVTLVAVSLLVLDYILLAPNFFGTYFFGRQTIILYWLLQMFFLGGSRITYRYFRYTRTRRHARDVEAALTLILGQAADADMLIRAVESGAVKKIWPVGILSPSPADQGQLIRSIRVLGDIVDVERVVTECRARGENITRLVLAPSALESVSKVETIVMQARRLGLTTSRLPSLDEAGEALRLLPVKVEDLLLRPHVEIDYDRLRSFILGKSIVVTGGGGSIGAEICQRIVSFGAARVLVIENSELALHGVLEALATKEARVKIEGRLADVRDRKRIFGLIGKFKPDIVFHAAALKHVPLLEQNWDEGVKTNILGSVNVADATAAAGAAAMVMISTDKAIEPVSVLGASKRFAEMYCQALDSEVAQRAEGAGTRMIAVRFGNVLASNGSVVPKFKAQIDAGGPVTVTHPDMVRYFMTIREACDLVIMAARHALGPERPDVAVYVLNMGEPVKIVDLAERMIRLSGLEPGRDVDITFTGMRPGERLQEILFAREEPTASIGIEGIVAARPESRSLEDMKNWLVELERGLACEDRSKIFAVFRQALPDFLNLGS